VGCGYHAHEDRARQLCAEVGGLATPISYDLTSESAAATAVADMISTSGALDAVIVNAGTWNGGRLATLPPADWWTVVERNIGGMVSLCRASLPALSEASEPSITLMSSVVGLIGNPGDTAYATAKSAMVGFARSLAKEVARDNIRVNVLAPGFVETDMTAAVAQTARNAIEQRTILGRFGTAEEIARAAVFLSEDATFCTGSILTADGGWSL
jgi:3-oxoacyl-[acyl-carrier protein] reductase